MLPRDDFREFMEASDALRASQRDMAAMLVEQRVILDAIDARIGRLQHTTAEIKELLIRWLDR